MAAHETIFQTFSREYSALPAYKLQSASIGQRLVPSMRAPLPPAQDRPAPPDATDDPFKSTPTKLSTALEDETSLLTTHTTNTWRSEAVLVGALLIAAPLAAASVGLYKRAASN